MNVLHELEDRSMTGVLYKGDEGHVFVCNNTPSREMRQNAKAKLNVTMIYDRVPCKVCQAMHNRTIINETVDKIITMINFKRWKMIIINFISSNTFIYIVCDTIKCIPQSILLILTLILLNWNGIIIHKC